MTKDEFSRGVSELRLAFDLDEVRKPVLATWYGYGVEEIPAAEWKTIARKIILNEDRFPQNFIKTVLAYRGPKAVRRMIEIPDGMTPLDIEENQRLLAELAAGIGVDGDRDEGLSDDQAAVLLSRMAS